MSPAGSQRAQGSLHSEVGLKCSFWETEQLWVYYVHPSLDSGIFLYHRMLNKVTTLLKTVNLSCDKLQLLSRV